SQRCRRGELLWQIAGPEPCLVLSGQSRQPDPDSFENRFLPRPPPHEGQRPVLVGQRAEGGQFIRRIVRLDDPLSLANWSDLFDVNAERATECHRDKGESRGMGNVKLQGGLPAGECSAEGGPIELGLAVTSSSKSYAAGTNRQKLA